MIAACQVFPSYIIVLAGHQYKAIVLGGKVIAAQQVHPSNIMVLEPSLRWLPNLPMLPSSFRAKDSLVAKFTYVDKLFWCKVIANCQFRPCCKLVLCGIL